jgi:tRNA(adenine34) deaminase
MWSRRAFGSLASALACGGGLSAASDVTAAPAIDLSAMPTGAHARAMRQAIAEAHGNRAYPFGAVVVRASDGELLATGVNKGALNPMFHGEIVAINDYVARHGNSGWGEAVLYTTGEPCPMCMSAMVWAGIGGVVWGTSIEKLRQFGINQILISADTVTGASPFYHGAMLGHVLQTETDALFQNRKRS